MKRQTGWRSRLDAELRRSQSQAFTWGSNDCASFVSRCVEACTGADYRSRFPSGYTDAAGALETLRTAGFEDLPALIGSLFEEVHPSRAAIGDICAIDVPGIGWCLGICLGERIGVMALEGYGYVPRANAQRAWRI